MADCNSVYIPILTVGETTIYTVHGSEWSSPQRIARSQRQGDDDTRVRGRRFAAVSTFYLEMGGNPPMRMTSAFPSIHSIPRTHRRNNGLLNGEDAGEAFGRHRQGRQQRNKCPVENPVQLCTALQKYSVRLQLPTGHNTHFALSPIAIRTVHLSIDEGLQVRRPCQLPLRPSAPLGAHATQPNPPPLRATAVRRAGPHMNGSIAITTLSMR
jgi:hypothetical protein